MVHEIRVRGCQSLHMSVCLCVSLGKRKKGSVVRTRSGWHERPPNPTLGEPSTIPRGTSHYTATTFAQPTRHHLVAKVREQG